MAARCAHCGEALRPQSMFCLSCGQLVAQAAPTPTLLGSDTKTQTDVPRPASIDPQPVGPAFSRVPIADERPSSFGLKFSTGVSYDLDDEVLVGRNPQSAADTEGIAALSLDDPEKSVSRVHAHLRSINGQVWVTDRGSANGTHIERGGRTIDCPVDTPVAARPGDTIWIGSVSCSVLIDFVL